MKGQVVLWEKIFIKDTFHEGLIPKYNSILKDYLKCGQNIRTHISQKNTDSI